MDANFRSPKVTQWHDLFARGSRLAQAGQLDAALEIWEEANELHPYNPDLLLNLGTLSLNLGRIISALKYYDQALILRPVWDVAFNAKGNALVKLAQHAQAIACYDRALNINPARPDSLYSRGTVFMRLQALPSAARDYGAALRCNPNFIQALYGLGLVNSQLGKLPEALNCFERVCTLNDQFAQIQGLILHTRMKMCDFRLQTDQLARLAQKCIENPALVAPFEATTFWDKPDLLHLCAKTYATGKHSPIHSRTQLSHTKEKKIKVGYFSADFHMHATSYLIAGLFEQHSKSEFHITAYSFRPINDEMTVRIKNAVDAFVDISSTSDSEAVSLIRTSGLDIAVDLKGYTELSRPGLFALGLAPVQVNYLGFPGTMGTPFIDYILADHTVIPAAAAQHYTEKIAYLPYSYQATDNKRAIAPLRSSRRDECLPDHDVVYCCFNNNFKMTPVVFECWMRILKATPGSVLWLLGDNPYAELNLKQECARLGVTPDRLIFAPRVSVENHLARLCLADLFLDTLPYNAHTSASDALWAGLPVLTCMGEAFASRVAASLLTAIGLTELITGTVNEYEALAISLGQDHEKLASLRRKLIANQKTTPLFDTQFFTHCVEIAYKTMQERSAKGLSPESFSVTVAGDSHESDQSPAGDSA